MVAAVIVAGGFDGAFLGWLLPRILHSMGAELLVYFSLLLGPPLGFLLGLIGTMMFIDRQEGEWGDPVTKLAILIPGVIVASFWASGTLEFFG